MCRERMTQRVGAERCRKSRLARISFQDLPESDSRQTWSTATRIHEQPQAGALAEKYGTTFPHVSLHPSSCFVANRDDALFVALPGARQIGRAQVDIGRP